MKAVPHLILVAAAASFAAQATIDVPAYRAALEQIDGRLARGDRPGAAAEAERLLSEQIDWHGETLRPDQGVLGPIADAEEQGVRGPLRALIGALPEAAGGATESLPPAPDKAALDSLRAREAAAELRAGGVLPGAPLKKQPFLDQVWEWVKTGFRWVFDRLVDLWRWLRKWWPEPRPAAEPGGSGSLNAWVFVVVGMIVVLVIALAVRAALRQGEAQPVERARAARTDADEDPLARAAGEWEVRAAELQSAGRFREAIRAWYHALLAASFRAGYLHHRRGRTNWEYARSLPGLAWRSRFVELTGRFDLEWYGRAESTPQAAASFAAEVQTILGELARRAA